MMIKPNLRLGFQGYETRIDNLFGLSFILLFLFQVCVCLSNKSGMFVMKSVFLA